MRGGNPAEKSREEGSGHRPTLLAAVIDPRPNLAKLGAVLAALNIADELSALEERYSRVAGGTKESVRNRASQLTGLLDAVLSEERKIG